ncbi:Formyltransferase [Ramaria rubella]|nr:Formyltransferase [Ramaria rubella]
MLKPPPFLRSISNYSPTRFNILFLGQDEFSCSVFRRLHAADVWREMWVATNPDSKTGRRGKDLAVSPLKLLAQSLSMPFDTVPPKYLGLKTWEARAIPEPFQKTPTDSCNILIAASFGHVIPVSILNLFEPTRRLNVHPSLLPLYRGPAPIQHAIADGRKETGVSILSLAPFAQGLDSGDVWASRAVRIPERATFQSLRDILADEGAELLVSTLRAMATGTATAIPQVSTQCIFAPLINRNFTQIDWDVWDAHKLDRVHRAVHHQHALVTILPYSPTLQLEQFAIHCPPEPLHLKLAQPGDAVYDHFTQSIIIRCAGQTEISVTLLQQENKRVLRAHDFWNGIRPEGLQDGILKLRSFSS